MIPATSDRVHTIVFWSKNFGPFIEGGYGKRLLDQGHNLYFNFTINSDNEKLEPGVPPLTERVTQMERPGRSLRAKNHPVAFRSHLLL